MIRAIKLKPGTKFSASGYVGILEKKNNSEDKAIATVVFGNSPEEVGKEVTLEGNLPCFIIPSSQKKKHDNVNKNPNHEKKQDKRPKQKIQNSNTVGITVVQEDIESIIFAAEHPSTEYIAAITGADIFRIDEREYEITHTAFEVETNTIYVLVKPEPI